MLLFLLGFGCLVEARGALIHGRHTDAGTYFRAAWAVRVGANPYLVVDRNGWHYTYPPLLASITTLLADAPPGYSRHGLLPYPVLIGLWYVLNAGFMVAGIWTLADAIQTRIKSLTPTDDARTWFDLRLWPFFLCLPVICRGTVRGQVGPIWLWLCCVMIADVIRRRPFRAGLWLAGAICLKLIPVYLLLYPLWRRMVPMLAGCALGVVVGGVLIPWVAMGPHGFMDGYRQYLHSTVLPGITGGRIDRAVEHELLDPRTSDTQGFRSVLMNIGHMVAGTPRSYDPPRFARVGAWLLAALCTGGVLFSAGFRPTGDPFDEALLLSMLTVVMLPIAPVCHPHYLILLLPLIATLLGRWRRPGEPSHQGLGWTILLLLIPASHIITSLPNADPFRDSGVVIWAALALVAAAGGLLYRSRTTGSGAVAAFASGRDTWATPL